MTLRTLFYYPYQEKKKAHLFHIHLLSNSKTHRASRRGGPCALELLQLCSEWLADLQTLCSFSWYAIAIPFLFLRHPFGFCLFFFSTSFGFSFFLVWNSGPPSKAKWKSQNFSTLFSRCVTLSLTLCRISLFLELLFLQI